jgi:hypothetical protein
MNRRPVTETVEEFNWTYREHGGDVMLASTRLGMQPRTLAKALYRAKSRGSDVKFLDNTYKVRKVIS